jgi:hypothetical protein
LARTRQARTATPDQLTLDDWAGMLKVSSPAPETPGRAAASVDSAHSAGAAENGNQQRSPCARAAVGGVVRHHPVAKELLETPGALLTRTHLRELGLERRAVDAVFRKLPVVSLPGYSRPMIHVEQYLDLIRESTYCDDRVRPSHA